MTCWRRLRDWQEAGVWEALVRVLLSELRETDRLDWSRATGDSASARAMGGGEKTGPNPTERRKPGHPRHRPDEVDADRADDSETYRDELRRRGIEPHLANRNTKHGSGLGIYRWVSERTLSWLHQFRRLKTRYDRREDIHEGFMKLAQSIICFRALQTEFC